MTVPVRAVRPPRAAGPATSSAGAGTGRAADPAPAALPAGTQLFVNHRLALRFERRRRGFLAKLANVTARCSS